MQRIRISRYLPLFLGMFVVLTTIVFIVLGGSAFFYDLSISSSRVELHKVFGDFFYLVYYTIQTNLFLGITMIFLFFKPQSKKTQSIFFSSVVMITVTFIIYWVVIAPFNTKESWQNIYLNFDNIITHVINPFIGFFYLIFIRHKITVNKKIVGLFSLYMSVFVVLNLILYISTITIDENISYHGVTVYPFLEKIFTKIRNIPILSIILNVCLVIISPFIPIGLSVAWIKFTKIRTTKNSYFKTKTI